MLDGKSPGEHLAPVQSSASRPILGSLTIFLVLVSVLTACTISDRKQPLAFLLLPHLKEAVAAPVLRIVNRLIMGSCVCLGQSGPSNLFTSAGVDT